MSVIDGRKIAEEIIAGLKSQPKPDKFFGAVLVGDDPASLNFLKQKEKVAQELGVDFRLYKLPTNITTDKLRAEIGRLAGVKNCGGFIVQLPLPEGVNRHYVLNAIPKDKDADVLSETALGAFYSGRGRVVPPSVGAVEEILSAWGGSASGGKHERRNLRELTVVVIGAGFLIGKPVGFWLQNKVAELTILDSASEHLRDKLKEADVVVCGAGRAGLISVSDLKDNALVIDFGFNRSEGKIVGDFNPEANEALSYKLKAINYTPTPGGTGPILVAKLFENFYTLNS
ncbi:MAG: bifunctional 5,10-methylenetetrahydrofolate dehydrogenase/5,10-methenyltetrahydrofolate cyclohydrolase [Patescibacteria group bacterium]